MIFKKAKDLYSQNRKGFEVAIIRISGMMLAYLLFTAIGRYFGTEILGRFSLAQTILQFGSLLLSFGFFGSVISYTNNSQHFENGKVKSNFFKDSAQILLISCLVASLAIFFGRDYVATNWFNDSKFSLYLLFIALGLPFYILLRYFSEFASGIRNFKEYALVNFLYPNLLTILILLIILGLGLYVGDYDLILNVSFFIPFLLVAIYLLAKYRNQVFVKDTSTQISKKELLQFSIPMMFGALFYFLNNWTDVLVLGVMVDKAELGIYNAAYKTAALSQLAVFSFNSIFITNVAKYYNEKAYSKIRSATFENLKIINLISIPIIIFLIAFPNWVMAIFGNEFQMGTSTLIILSVGFLTNALTAGAAPILLMTENQKTVQNITLIGAILNVILNILLIPIYSINGAAWASVASMVFMNIAFVYFVYKKFKFIPIFGAK